MTLRCGHRVPESVGACTACTDSEGVPPGCENMFHLFLRLQDERGNAQITVSVDQNVSFLCVFTIDANMPRMSRAAYSMSCRLMMLRVRRAAWRQSASA
jgi:hypothetical protein